MIFLPMSFSIPLYHHYILLLTMTQNRNDIQEKLITIQRDTKIGENQKEIVKIIHNL
jgi:hypothetical protein